MAAAAPETPVDPWYLKLATYPTNSRAATEEAAEVLVTHIQNPNSQLALNIKACHEQGKYQLYLHDFFQAVMCNVGFELRVNEVLRRRVPELSFRVVCHHRLLMYDEPETKVYLLWFPYLADKK